MAIQVELDELEEQGIEPTTHRSLSKVLDQGMSEESDSEGSLSCSSSGSRGDKDLAGTITHDDDDAFDALEDLSDEDGYDASDALDPGPRATDAMHEPAWNEVAVLAGKLDAIMKALH